jgi:uroporphyrinogen decarboxylase
MNSRERTLTALNHKEPDMVPIDFGASKISGIMAIAYNKLKKYLDFKEGETKLYDIKQQLADPHPKLIKLMGGDIIQLYRLKPTTGMDIKVDRWKKGELVDGEECLVPEEYSPVKGKNERLEIRKDGNLIAFLPKGAIYFENVYTPLAKASTYKDIDSYPWPEITEEESNFLRAKAKNLFYETDFAILGAVGTFGGSFFEIGHLLFGYENFLLKLITDRDLIEYFLDRLLENYLRTTKKYLEIVGKYVHIIQLNDDFGAQDSLLISPILYREIFKPRQAKLIEFIKKNSKAFVFLHSDGSIKEIIPDLIDIGVDIINPVQTSAKGMKPRKLKTEFGKYITFWGGGIDTQTTLPFGSLENIEKEVKERMEIFAPKGGYVFCPIHNIQADIPPEKILTVFETAKKIRKYPIEISGEN